MIAKYFDIRNSAFGVRSVLANPPFNDSDWFRKDDDVRWQYGVPPRGNANFAWVQHFIHHLAPHGMAGFVLVRFWFWLKLNAPRASKRLDNRTAVSFRERRCALIEVELADCHWSRIAELLAKFGSN
jgi:hypothetical protein